MDGNEFCRHFQLASCFCRDFTNRHISEDLPTALRYNFARLERKQSQEEKVIFNNEAYLRDQLENLSPKEAAQILFKSGFIPVWIDLFVGSFNEEYTTIEITFSKDFTDQTESLFHKKEGYPPFHVVGPTAPKDWRSLEENGPFPFIQFT